MKVVNQMSEQNTPVIIAAIDVGSSAIRMEIAEVSAGGALRILENLSKGVSLGKDTFTTGQLGEETLQTACQALSDFSKVMQVYGVSKYRAVTTSAVREAANADTFLDRAFIRSGIDIEIISGSEENRLTYLAIQEALRDKVDWHSQNSLIVEVGGGSTDISFMQAGTALHSGNFPLGAVRLRQTLIAMKADFKQRVRILDRQIKNTIDSISNTIPFDQASEVIALGGDIRFAAKQLSTQQHESSEDLWVIRPKEFSKFCGEVARLEIDGLVRQFNLAYAQAETLVPALFAYKHIFDRTKAERIVVLGVSIRNGLLLDMARREFGKRMESLEEQILASARALARKYRSNENHIEQVRMLSLSLFDQLQAEHGLENKERLLLEAAAILHDIGRYVSDRSHHKHTQYLIGASEIFGLSREDIDLIANIARYHRKSAPMRTHPAYASLDRDSRMIVSKLAALLRVADALDQDYSKKIKNLRVAKDEERSRYVLEVEAEGDLTMERFSVETKGDLFKAIFGKPIVLGQVEETQ